MHVCLFCTVILGIIALDGVSGQRRRNNNRTHISQDERALGSFLQRVAVGRAIPCQSDADCSKGGKNKCMKDDLFLCGRPPVAAMFQAADDTTCAVDTDCKTLAGAKKLAYRCGGGKCDFCGPRVCQTDADCCTPGQGETQKCAKVTGYAEHRCWKGCSTIADCQTKPGPMKGKIICSEGVCQKRGRRNKV